MSTLRSWNDLPSEQLSVIVETSAVSHLKSNHYIPKKNKITVIYFAYGITISFIIVNFLKWDIFSDAGDWQMQLLEGHSLPNETQ